MHRNDLLAFINEYLEVDDFKDASKNGLQVEGSEKCEKIMTAATASVAAIKEAKAYGIDTLIVHHGILWKGDPNIIGGAFKERVKLLLDANINLMAYHLPIDANMQIGNNYNLAQLLKLENLDYIEPNCKNSIAICGTLSFAMILRNIINIFHDALHTRVMLLGKSDKVLNANSRVCICSGSGSFLMSDDTRPQFDLLITGDLNEQSFHLSREYQIPVIALGHDASEQSGVRMLGTLLQDRFSLEHTHYVEDRESEARIYESL